MQGAGELAFNEFRLDPANALLWRGDDRIVLPPKPFEVLCWLAAHAGQLVTKDELLDAVWSNLHVSESSLSVSINALRTALGDDPKAPRYIETVPRRGYRFIAPVTVSTFKGLSGAKSRVQHLGAEPQSRYWVGRVGTLNIVEDILDQAIAGDRQLVFVTGEAGIGKTTLIELLVERVSRRGAGVLLGHCVQHFGTDEAFHPFIEALQEGCRSPDRPSLLKILRHYAPTWLAQMPGLLNARDHAALQKEIFGATRERMLREFCELLEVLSSNRPWVFIVEDLHWSDYATLDALSRFAQGDQKTAVAVFVTYRPGDVMIERHPAGTVHHELRIHRRCRELALDNLTLADVEDYLALRFGEASIAQALAGEIFRRTAGHPLFVVSLVDHFVALEVILEVDGHWSLAAQKGVLVEGMPHDLREMLSRRIGRLSAEELCILEAASAAGAEFSAGQIAGALDRDIPAVEQVCESLARKDQILIRAGMDEWPDGTVAGHYAFSHGLYQEVLYQGLAPGQRIRLHRQLGRRLETGYGPRTLEVAPILALHFEAGREFGKAVHYLGQAAESSAERFGNREAAIYLTRALELVRHLPAENQLATRAKLLQHRGRVRRSAGDLKGSLEDLTTIVSAADGNLPLIGVKALLDLSRFCIWGDRKRCLEFAERALERSQDLNDDILTALAQGNSASLKLYLKGWRDEDANCCHQALKVIGDAQDPRIRARTWGIRSVLQLLTSNYRDCCIAADKCSELAQRRGDIYLYVIYNAFAAYALLQVGAWHEARQRLNEALLITQKNANRQVSCLSHLMLAWLQIETLDFKGARACCEEALDPEVEENPVNFFLGRNLLARASLGLRDYSAAHEQLGNVAHRIEVVGIRMETVFQPLFYHSLCEYWLAIGNMVQARQNANNLYEIARRPPEHTYLAQSHRLLAKIAIAEGCLEEARIQLSRAISIVEQSDVPLAAWRIYATAAEFYESAGEIGQADKFKRLCDNVIHSLAETLDQNDKLRSSLISAYAAQG
jgi:DNA-binding winged helix-turn-helix (wHTH) protein/tetratricopeptide (TPR) repeat protein